MTVVVFTLRRLVGVVITLLASSVLIFAALTLTPGDPAAGLAGGGHPDPAVLDAIRAEYHLNDPFWVQYWHWLSNLVTGDLGRSVVYRSDVADLLAGRVVNTVLLVTYSSIIVVGVGIALGVLAGLRSGRTSIVITTATTVAMGIPSFVMSIVLIWVFATHLSWFPIYGSGSGFIDKLHHLTLPALAISFSFIAYIARTTRSAVAAEVGSEHVDTARSRGLSTAYVTRHHVLRNASAPISAISATMVATLVAGTAVVESAFGVSGLGSLLVSAAQRQDIAVVQILAMFMVTVFVVANTLVDVVNVALDPRLARKEARS